MRPARKKVSLISAFADVESSIRSALIDGPKDWLMGARDRLRDLPKTNYDLGYRFAREGKWMDAIFRFKIVLYLRPEYPNANYNLGCCYMRLGKMAEAKAALQKALQQAPGNTDVIFMLTSVDPNAVPANQRPSQMPLEMVTGFFSSVSEGYDISEANNKYQAGKVIHDLVQPLMKTQAPVVLDLACGSGIPSRPWRVGATSIRGIDATPEMVSLAEKATHAERKLFERVLVGDVAQLPAELADGSADLVLLVNAAQFIGDLSSTLSGAAQALKAGGMFVITVEPFAAQAGFGLVADTSRFGHSNAYVKHAAVSAGFTLEKEATVELYAGVPAQALVFSKGSN